MVLKECCSKCGLPTKIPRETIFLDDNILNFFEYEENTCKECGHQIDGSTLPLIYKLIQYIGNKFIKERKNLIRFLNYYNYLTKEERRKVCVMLPRFMKPDYKSSGKSEEDDIEEPYSWNAVYLEVLNDTSLLRVMLMNINWEDLK